MTINDPHVKETDTSEQSSIRSEASDQASRLAGSVKDEVTRREQNFRSGVADRAESVAEGLRKAKSEIDPDSTIAVMFDRAADSVSGLADSLNSTDPTQMLGDVRRFARSQPGAFLGLSALAGFAAVRFLRAGSTTSTSPDPVRSSSYGTSGMTRQTPSQDRASVSPVGAASLHRPAGSIAGADQGASAGTARPVSTSSPTLSGNRNIGGSHD
ncbi:hypothetical protein [Paracoccus sp. 08]|uniref:hypothetical protein n=1 Tax=Paracoccus sp. 08 TaxID=2606624 RepID=UPI0020941DD0|nr:hypothetical protein [Paracoccus sp. 08]MCO6364607.1 hypothetical protein [Paracoccus sp. 08]